MLGRLVAARVRIWHGVPPQNDVVTRAAAAAAGCFATRYSTVFDGIIGPWFLPTFSSATGLDTLQYLILLPSVEDCVERVTTRQGHGFADEPATRKMHDEFSRAEIAERHVLRDRRGTPEAIADEVVTRFETGSITYQPEPPRTPGR
jgi:hypothetical protein